MQKDKLKKYLEEKLGSKETAQKAMDDIEAEYNQKDDWTEDELTDLMNKTLENYGYDTTSEPAGTAGAAPVVI